MKVSSTNLCLNEKQYIIINQIQQYFSTCKSEYVLHGYTCVYNFMTDRFDIYSDKYKIIINLFNKELYIKAKKYNNIWISDKTTYDLEVDRMLKMCEIITRNRCNSIYPVIIDAITNSWNKAEQYKNNILIGYIVVQKELPGGDPCWMGWMISSYLYSHDGHGFGTLLSK